MCVRAVVQTWETHLNMGPGDNVLYVNGLQADLDAYDMFTLLDTLRNEARLLEGLHSLAEQVRVYFIVRGQGQGLLSTGDRDDG
jgi:hypothetical protein